jgi:hypothetical protein
MGRWELVGDTLPHPHTPTPAHSHPPYPLVHLCNVATGKIPTDRDHNDIERGII